MNNKGKTNYQIQGLVLTYLRKFSRCMEYNCYHYHHIHRKFPCSCLVLLSLLFLYLPTTTFLLSPIFLQLVRFRPLLYTPPIHQIDSQHLNFISLHRNRSTIQEFRSELFAKFCNCLLQNLAGLPESIHPFGTLYLDPQEYSSVQ